MPSQAILDRIAKCDRLATSSNPGEAAAAKAMAEKLRKKYAVPHRAQPRGGSNFRYLDATIGGQWVDPEQLAELLRRAFGE